MLDDRTKDKDFNVNNVYLNVNFEDWEETFEYKYPVLDHPSNYQMTVTKFKANLSEPYIKLHESKKQTKMILQEGDPFYFDYSIAFRSDHLNVTYRSEGKKKVIDKKNIIERISRTQINVNYPGKLDDNSQALLKTEVEKNPYIEFNRTKSRYELKDGEDINDAKNWGTSNHIHIRNDEYKEVKVYYFDEEDNKEKSVNVLDTKDTYWHEPYSLRDIYSINQFLGVINKGIFDCLSYFRADIKAYGDPYFRNLEENLTDNNNDMFFVYEEGRLKLKINHNLAKCLCIDHYYKAPTENADKTGFEDLGERKIRFFISQNLFRYLKGFKFNPSWEVSGFYELALSVADYNSSKTEMDSNEIDFNIYEGEQINIMDWADYIGFAVVSSDFPIKRQVYPHFKYDFENPSAENRRRYTSYEEEDIEGYRQINGRQTTSASTYFVGEEYINEQIKKGNEDGILFVKYFGNGEDLNNINYENNDSNTSLKMDLINSTPLQNFTLKLYWIDRYNNFIPFEITPYLYDDVVKMQLHFQRIKGPEKENRYIIEPIDERGETIITGMYDLPGKGRVVLQNDPKTGQLMEEVIPIPPQKKNKIEEFEEINPLHELY